MIGRLQLAEEEPVSPVPVASSTDVARLYRLTSPVYWLVRLVDLVRWLGSTAKRRGVAILGTVGLAILVAVVSGWAQAFFTKVLGGP